MLWHYTSKYHLPYIVEDGCISTTESNIDPRVPNFGPDVVWALDTIWVPRDGELPHGLTRMKTQARIAFKAPRRAVKWTEWGWTAKMDPVWREGLVRAAGGEEVADHWWIVDHPIIARHWIGVEYLKDGRWISERL